MSAFCAGAVHVAVARHHRVRSGNRGANAIVEHGLRARLTVPTRPARDSVLAFLTGLEPSYSGPSADALTERRPATLDVYGDGPLRTPMEALAVARPWLTLHGARPWPEGRSLA